ncbi:hypothetical protein HX021_16690 [Sphingobacterium sp. N143]|uniref:hypothetical protein n=1 Tax=Sphingobacterium sp. N143 TaxID=2746727 RepID=UPI002578448A|nr:hypothetical protein [Sphingobacterium sp. N143]MDM1295930.1 hypothetical protein [Sphingobacterium sp. N143]
MKKIIFVVVCVMLIACNKQDVIDSSTKDKKEFKVKFSTKGFKTSIKPFASKTKAAGLNSVEDSISKMNFFVYKLDNTLVGNYAQTSADPDFGTLNVKLSEGKYKIGIVAYSNYPYLDVSSNGIYHSLLYTPDYDSPYVYLGNLNEELFSYGYQEFVVANDSTYSPFELKRLNALFELEILDEIPNDAAEMIIDINQGTSMTLFNEEYLSPASEVLENYFDLSSYRGQEGSKFPVIVFPELKLGSTATINISVYNNAVPRQRIRYVTISDVEFKPNFITKASGVLFGDESIGIGTTLLEDYDGNIPVEY